MRGDIPSLFFTLWRSPILHVEADDTATGGCFFQYPLKECGFSSNRHLEPVAICACACSRWLFGTFQRRIRARKRDLLCGFCLREAKKSTDRGDFVPMSSVFRFHERPLLRRVYERPKRGSSRFNGHNSGIWRQNRHSWIVRASQGSGGKAFPAGTRGDTMHQHIVQQ